MWSQYTYYVEITVFYKINQCLLDSASLNV